jgi:hypothetical protein
MRGFGALSLPCESGAFPDPLPVGHWLSTFGENMQFLQNLKTKLVPAAGIGGLLAAGAAHANSAGSSAFNSAITSASTDIATFGAALVGVSAVGVVFMIAIKYVKKIRGAA